MKEQIFRDVCIKAQEVTGLDIRYTRSRKRDIVHTKCAIVNVLNRLYSFNLVQIGRLIGYHHTTVIHFLKDHSSRYRYDDEYCQIYDQLSKHAMDTTEYISIDKMLVLMKSSLSV